METPVKTLAECKIDFLAAKDALDAAAKVLRDAQKEVAAAMVRETAPHPLHGRKVKRQTKTWGISQWKNQHGTMQQNGHAGQLYACRRVISPGQHYVRSMSGKTVYDTDVDASHTPWELAE